MSALEDLVDQTGLKLWRGLTSPDRIQSYLDSIPYSADKFYRCPRRVVEDRTAHCFDGALFAAAALRRLGYPALIVDMYAVRDDDHMIALFRRRGGWGAVAKSNYVGLRFREPVYRSLRELIMSYFNDFYNPAGERTLRTYTRPINLARFDRLGWEVSDDGLERIARHTERVPRIQVITRAMAMALTPVDERTRRAGLQGARRAGLYQGPMRRRKGRRG
jgi:hypothetical protein